MLSYVGGLISIIKFFAFQLASLVNAQQFKFKLAKKMYFSGTPNFLKMHFRSVSNRYRFVYEKWKTIEVPKFYQWKTTRKIKLDQRLSEDLDFLNIVDTLYKLRATLEVLVADNKETVLKA